MTNVTDPVKGFQLTIKTLYDIEQQLLVALPKMAKAATNTDLSEGLTMHLKETEGHCKRLEKIFDMIDVPAEKHAGEAIRGLIADGRAIMVSEIPAELKDAMLAGAGREVEHFEMASYMNAIEEAKGLELTDAVELLEQTLAEEDSADKSLEFAVKDNLALAKTS